MIESYTLFQLNEYIKRVIALNFAEPIWITCEISQINEVRGNYYLDLIQKKIDSQEIIAQSKANIWYKQALFISRKLGEWMPEILQEGIEIKCKVEVDFSERYGFSLKVVDIDPAYTVGKMALDRAKIIERLKKERLISKNKDLTLPHAIQRVAIISSSGAAGFKDFLKHIEDNPYQYRFEIHLFEAAMQGTRVANDLIKRLNEINNSKVNFDLVAIMRGGGSKLDLSGFDNYDIGVAIAGMNIPVITGIGHEIDQTVADIVSFLEVKTPTAVADFIIEHNLRFESKILDQFDQIRNAVLNRFRQEDVKLESIKNNIFQLTTTRVFNGTSRLELINQELDQLAHRKIIEAKHKLEIVENKIQLLNPQNVLERGFSFSTFKGKRIHSVEEIHAQDEIKTLMSDGMFISQVKSINKGE